MWRDRISGQVTEAPVEPVVPGQWELAAAHGRKVRGVLMRPGEVLLPEQDGRYRLHGSTLRSDPRLGCDEDGLRALRVVGSRLAALEGASWLEWADESPLTPEIDKTLDPSPLELLLGRKIGTLEALFRRPRTHLKVESERMLVGRCKRPDPRASSVLAARSEDWQRRTLWGIQPKKVLGRVRDDLYDIYENRLAVALVDRLDWALIGRIRAVRRVVDLLQQEQDYQDLIGGPNYRRARRILSLWGQSLTRGSLLQEAQQTLARLIALRRRILGLKDSSLYGRLGSHRSATIRLKRTNILTNDELYRAVAEVWQAWKSHQHDSIPTPEDRWRLDQEAAAAFDRFALLLIVRASVDLGYQAPLLEAPVQVESVDWSVELAGPLGPVTLARGPTGFTLGLVGGPLLTIVTVMSQPAASPRAGAWLAGQRSKSPTLVLHLAPDARRADEASLRRLNSLGNLGEGDGLMFCQVAPWDLESAERVARALRWHIWGGAYSRYPRRLESPARWKPPSGPTPHWLRQGDALTVVAPARSPAEMEWGALAERATKLATQVAELEVKLSGEKGQRGKLRVEQQLAQARDDLARDRAVEQQLQDAQEQVSRLLRCPVCPSSFATPYAFSSGEDYFRAECTGCGASWGLRTCRHCNGPVPFLDFAEVVVEDVEKVDRACGSDVLSIPVGEGSHLCPTCGVAE